MEMERKVTMNENIPTDLEEKQVEAFVQSHPVHVERSSHIESIGEENHNYDKKNPRSRKRPFWMIDYEMDCD